MVNIRKACSGDAQFIARMIMIAMHFPMAGNEERFALIERLVENENTLYYWERCCIAVYDNKPVGLCLAYDGRDYHERRVCSFDIQQADESCEGEFYVDSLAVIPEMRGKGIGRMLVQNAVERGKSMHLTPTILVAPDNAPAVKLYESVGFKGKEDIFVFGQNYWKMKAE